MTSWLVTNITIYVEGWKNVLNLCIVSQAETNTYLQINKHLPKADDIFFISTVIRAVPTHVFLCCRRRYYSAFSHELLHGTGEWLISVCCFHFVLHKCVVCPVLFAVRAIQTRNFTAEQRVFAAFIIAARSCNFYYAYLFSFVCPYYFFVAFRALQFR